MAVAGQRRPGLGEGVCDVAVVVDDVAAALHGYWFKRKPRHCRNGHSSHKEYLQGKKRMVRLGARAVSIMKAMLSNRSIPPQLTMQSTHVQRERERSLPPPLTGSVCKEDPAKLCVSTL